MKTLYPHFENVLSEFMYVVDVLYVLRKRRKMVCCAWNPWYVCEVLVRFAGP